MADDIRMLAEAESRVIAGHFGAARKLSPPALNNEAADARLKLIDKLLDGQFLAELLAGDQIGERDMQCLRHDFRSLAAPLTIVLPEPIEEPRTSLWPVAACAGAVLGMLFLAALLRMFLGNEYRVTGLLVGAPLGAYALVAAVGYLSRHRVLLRWLQGILGVATVAEVASMFLSVMNPVRLVWRTLTKRFGGGGFLGSIKRIAFFIFAILLMQLAVPVTHTPLDQLEKNAHTAILSWLEQHVRLLTALASMNKSETDVESELPSTADRQLLRAMVKLHNAAGQVERADTGDEVILAFKNAGYEITSKRAADSDVFRESFRAEFDVEGMISEGDSFRILEEPLYKSGRLVLRGRITRSRRSQTT